MSTNKSTVDEQEVNKFGLHASQWWDKQGPLKTLHDINPIRLKFISQYISLADCLVLDVGCGGGVLSEGMAQQGAQVIGLDASHEAILAAQEHALVSNLVIKYEHSPVEDYEHSGFDAITCLELLEHVNHPEMVIEHCARLLKPNGFLFLSTINRTMKAYAGAVVVAEYILGLLPKQTHEYAKFIKPSELVEQARVHGLQLLGIQGLGYNPLMRTAYLTDDVSVNYLMVLQKT